MTVETPDYESLPKLPEEFLYLEEYTRPTVRMREEVARLQESGEATSTKYNHGLVIGRFQPPHEGHMLLFINALALCNKITIGIGSANVENGDNPFSPEIRRILLDRALRRAGIRERVASIVPIDDYGNGPVWLDAALRRTGPVDAVMGGNEWVNGIFEEAGYPVERLPRHGYAATDIREQLRKEGRLRRG